MAAEAFRGILGRGARGRTLDWPLRPPARRRAPGRAAGRSRHRPDRPGGCARRAQRGRALLGDQHHRHRRRDDHRAVHLQQALPAARPSRAVARAGRRPRPDRTGARGDPALPSPDPVDLDQPALHRRGRDWRQDARRRRHGPRRPGRRQPRSGGVRRSGPLRHHPQERRPGALVRRRAALLRSAARYNPLPGKPAWPSKPSPIAGRTCG